MCEATCVVKELEYLRDDLTALSETKLQALVVECLQNRIDGLIRQLNHHGEGQQWSNPEAVLHSSCTTSP